VSAKYPASDNDALPLHFVYQAVNCSVFGGHQTSVCCSLTLALVQERLSVSAKYPACVDALALRSAFASGITSVLPSSLKTHKAYLRVV
jgi:hypothetical protein